MKTLSEQARELQERYDAAVELLGEIMCFFQAKGNRKSFASAKTAEELRSLVDAILEIADGWHRQYKAIVGIKGSAEDAAKVIATPDGEMERYEEIRRKFVDISPEARAALISRLEEAKEKAKRHIRDAAGIHYDTPAPKCGDVTSAELVASAQEVYKRVMERVNAHQIQMMEESSEGDAMLDFFKKSGS